MTPLDNPEHLDKQELVEGTLRDLQSDIVDYRLERLLGGIKMMRKEIGGAGYNREAILVDGKINVLILPSKRGESAHNARANGIVAEKLFFDTTGKAKFQGEIEGDQYWITIKNTDGVGSMSLELIEHKMPEKLNRKGDLPAGSTVRMDGPILIVEDKDKHEIGMFNTRGRDLTEYNKEYDGTFFGNIANPALYDLYITNKGGELVFEFEKRPFDETPFEKKVKGSAIPAGKEWSLYFSNGEVGIVEIDDKGRPTLIGKIGNVDVAKLHKEQIDKKLILPSEDIKVSLYYLEGKFEAEAFKLDTHSYIAPKKAPLDTSLSDSKKTIETKDADKKTTEDKKDSKETDKKGVEGLPGENVVDLPYGVRMKFGEDGPEFGQYDMTIRSIKDNTVIDGYYLDYYRRLKIDRDFNVRRKEVTTIPIPFSKKKIEFPNGPDLNHDDDMFAIDIPTHELAKGGTRTYVDTEGDSWQVKVILDDKKILRVFVDAPLEKKKQNEITKQKQKDQEPIFDFPDGISFPEFNIVAKTKEQLEKVKEKLKQVMSDVYDEDENDNVVKDVTLVVPAQSVTIENGNLTIKGYAKHINALPPYSEEQLTDIRVKWIPKKGFKLYHATGYFDFKLDKDLVEIDLDNNVKKGDIIEKDGWKVKIDVNSKGILIVSAAPPADKANEVVKPKEKIDTKNLGFVWPIEGGEINSGFCTRTDPNTGVCNTPHGGVDIDASVGSRVLTPYDGIVVFSDITRGFGQLVILEHHVGNKKYRTFFAHLTPSSVNNLNLGDNVTRGEAFAKSGGKKGAPGSGNSTGPHLHYEVRVYDPTYKGKWKNRRPVDPLAFYDMQSNGVPTTPNLPPNSQPQPNNTPPQNIPVPNNTPPIINIPPSSGTTIEYQKEPFLFNEKPIPIPATEDPIIVEGLLNPYPIKTLTPVIKNLDSNRLAKIPAGRHAGYENGQFVLLDKDNKKLLVLDDLKAYFVPYAFKGSVIESQLTLQYIEHKQYDMKMVLHPGGALGLTMEPY